MKVFILEDDPNRMTYFNRVLKKEGTLIEWIDNAKEAIEYLKENYSTIDTIFLDHDLGGKVFVSSEEYNTGYTVAKYISDNFYGKFAHIIIHSMNLPASLRMQELLPGSHTIPFHFLHERLTIKE